MSDRGLQSLATTSSAQPLTVASGSAPPPTVASGSAPPPAASSSAPPPATTHVPGDLPTAGGNAEGISRAHFEAWMNQSMRDTHVNNQYLRNVLSDERAAMLWYHVINWIVNGLLIMQGGLSAVLIALGATGNIYRIQIAVLGGVNGVITGALSIVKGQGLPNRFFHYASGLRRVVERIDELERTIASGGIVTRRDLEDLSRMHREVRRQNDMNNPDTWKTDTELLHLPITEPISEPRTGEPRQKRQEEDV